LKPPAFIPEDRWRRCIEDGRGFLHQWGGISSAARLDFGGLIRPPQPAREGHGQVRLDSSWPAGIYTTCCCAAYVPARTASSNLASPAQRPTRLPVWAGSTRSSTMAFA
jgi:hypothetical protein